MHYFRGRKTKPNKPMRRFYLFIILSFLLLGGLTAQAQVNLSSLNSAYTQNFNSLASTGTAVDVSTLPTGWLFIETGTSANTTYAAGTGSLNTGNTYSFGLDATDRALGGLQSGSLVPTMGAQFQNNTGSIITSLNITYTGEQWRLGATARGADRLDFQYSTTATALNNGTWTNVDSLDFNSPITVGTVGALNGNLAANRTIITLKLKGLTIAPGSAIWIRWQDFNVTSSDDGLAIDDFSIMPMGVPVNQPSIAITPSSLNFGDVNLGSQDTLSFNVTGKNLPDSMIQVSSSNAAFQISSDRVNYSASINIIAAGGRVFTRFTPNANGLVTASVTVSSSATQTILPVSGKGYDPLANIITIAAARAKSSGTKVTVAGRVTSADQLGSPSYVQDATGGIPVFDYNFSNSITIGDSVIVTGPIGFFNNQVQISGNGIFFSKPDSSSRIIAPKSIQLSELLANEGWLVTVQQVELVNKKFVFYPQSTEQMTASGVTADLRIDGDTDIAGLLKPQGVVDITGVVGRFKTTAQLMPRFQADIPGTSLPSTPYDSIPKNLTFDLVNWNIEFFGARIEDYGTEYGPANEDQQRKNVKKVLDSLQADMIAIQEVSNDTTFNKMIGQMPKYKSICSERYSYSFNGPDSTYPPQKLCFIYDTTTVRIVSARPMFETLYDSARNGYPSLLPSYPTGDPQSFWSSGRLPFLVKAIVTIEGASKEINFINVHGKSGATEGDRLRRAYDAKVLKDSLDAYFPNKNFVILGDFNDDLDQSIVVGKPTPYLNMVQDTANYVPVTKTLADAGVRSTVGFNDMIDQQILSNELSRQYLAGSIEVVTPFRMIPDYGNTTSDHLAVTSRFHFDIPVVGFSTASVTTKEDSAATVPVSINFTESYAENKTITVSVTNGLGMIYGSDYITIPALDSGRLVLPVAAGTQTLSFQVKVLNDSIDELNESVLFTIMAQSGMQLSQDQLTVTIADDDVPSISFTTQSFSVEEGTNAQTVTVSLSQPPAADQSVTISLTNTSTTIYGSDYTTSPDGASGQLSLTIPAGSSSASFSFSALADDVKEKKLIETVTFNLTGVSDGLTIGSSTHLTATIIDVKKSKAKFTVSPNPTRGVVRLTEVDIDNDFDGVIYVVLYKMNGDILFSGSGTPTHMSDAISHALAREHNGIYMLNLVVEDESTTLRILKN